MKFYRLDFVEHAADEGDRWAFVERRKCGACGLMTIPFASEFPVPDDGVAHVHAEVPDFVDHPMMYVAGVILIETCLADLMDEVGMDGYSFRSAEVTCLDDEELRPLPDYRWLVVEGRCQTKELWEKVRSFCSECGFTITESLTSQTRKVSLVSQPPDGVDVFRGREDACGVIVSERFRDFCNKNIVAVDNVMSFVEVPIDSD